MNCASKCFFTVHAEQKHIFCTTYYVHMLAVCPALIWNLVFNKPGLAYTVHYVLTGSFVISELVSIRFVLLLRSGICVLVCAFFFYRFTTVYLETLFLKIFLRSCNQNEIKLVNPIHVITTCTFRYWNIGGNLHYLVSKFSFTINFFNTIWVTQILLFAKDACGPVLIPFWHFYQTISKFTRVD